MNRRLAYILLLIALGTILSATAKYLPLPVVKGAVGVIVLTAFGGLFISFRKKAGLTEQMSGLQKASSVIAYSSALILIIAVILLVFHLRHVGLMLVNVSLIVYIVAAVVGIIAQIKSRRNNGAVPGTMRRISVFGTVIYLGTICTVTGLLFRINHYPGGKVLMFGGLSLVILFFIVAIVYNRQFSRN